MKHILISLSNKYKHLQKTCKCNNFTALVIGNQYNIKPAFRNLTNNHDANYQIPGVHRSNHFELVDVFINLLLQVTIT